VGAPLFLVDAFASGPFTGNPAAVCLLDAPADPGWMQAVAAEMNLSETAFVHEIAGDAGRFGLRWFTPTVEVDLCGHATLASAHLLWETGRLPAGAVVQFETRNSGALRATRTGDDVELDFPADPVTPAEPDRGLLDAIGLTDAVGTSRGRIGWILEVADASAVRAARPDFSRLASFDIAVLTARSDDPAYDFVSRCFGPKFGIDEDPVTGSAHCALAPYWAARLARPELTGYQASARGGVVRVRVDGDRTRLGGRAVTVTRGELLA
jgi:PhzF family phenazine biosynthesis protein